ncbi:MAG TPA: hypothetical protein VGB18_03715 [Candidatus Thermoplasmatota archaeon]
MRKIRVLHHVRLLLASCVIALLAASACIDQQGGSNPGGTRGLRAPGLVTYDPAIPSDWFEIALPTGSEHNHRDASHHENLSTLNFNIVGYNPLITDYYGRTAGDYFCGDQRELDGRRLSVVHSWGSDVAFVLADVTDPTKPEKIGELAMANTQVYDVSLTPDLNFVVMSTSPFDSGPDAPEGVPPRESPTAPWGMWTDACGNERPLQGPESGLPFSSGIVLVDISNPRNPLVVDFRQLPVIGSHSVRVNDVKGETIITASVDNAAAPASYYMFLEITPTPAGPKLVPISTYHHIPENQANATSVGIHMDGGLYLHPITEQRLAFLAFRGLGMIIVDMDDPANPQFLAQFRPFPIGAHSIVVLPETWDGRHYTILGEECGGPSRGNPSCLVMIVDTTDPANPTYVSAWTLPSPVDWREGLEFSMHYFDIYNRTLFISTYHGGLWAVDLSTPEAVRTMPTIGVFVPSIQSPKPFGTPPRSLASNALLDTVAGAPLADHPVVMDLAVSSDGLLTVWDAQSGLYMVRFDATNPAPPPVFEIHGIPRTAS